MAHDHLGRYLLVSEVKTLEGSRITGTLITLDPPILRSPQVHGDTVFLTWSALPGRTYRVQFRTHLNDDTWQSLPGDVTAASTTAQYRDRIDGPPTHRFYRILQLP